MKLLAKKRNVTCYCDFCGTSDDEVSKMVDGKHAFICDRCVEAVRKIIQPQLSFGPLTMTEREPSVSARQEAFNILTRHPPCLRDDVSLNDLIDDIATAIDSARGENGDNK